MEQLGSQADDIQPQLSAVWVTFGKYFVLLLCNLLIFSNAYPFVMRGSAVRVRPVAQKNGVARKML